MPKHNDTGRLGEDAAANFLIAKGYQLLYRNWRHGKKEVDLIAFYRDIVVMAEVKTRSGTKLQFPEEAVTRSKQNNLHAAAEAFLAEYPVYRNVRFDIISVVTEGNHIREIVHFEEAF